MYRIIKKKIKLNKERKIIIETGGIANQSDGAVIIRAGNTILLATVVWGKEIENKTINLLPLTVEYREKYFAGGKIPGGFIKREGKYSEEEILTMRIVDRLIRPLLPKNLINELQIMIFLLSYDHNISPDGLVGLAASSALLISGIPYRGPASQVRIARIKERLIVNPSIKEIKKSDVNLIIGGTYKSILMVEGDMKEIKNKEFIKIIKYAHIYIKKQIKAQKDFYLRVKKKNKIIYKKVSNSSDNTKIKKIIRDKCYKKIFNIFYKNVSKRNRTIKFNKLYESINKYLKKKFTETFCVNNQYLINKYYNDYKRKIIRLLVINYDKRIDGRKTKDIRKIIIKNNLLPGVHGSTLFTRGETQALTTVTLGSSLDVNRIDNVVKEGLEKFYLHYNFPPFSTGEVKKILGVSRREVGHGNLAQKALKNMIPKDNPFTIRIVSDILESNGSSSMATVCAGSLALINAGIKIKELVAGVAIGYMEGKKKDKILVDILGEEDYYGDLDFKITRTKNGITACQMDIKNFKINIFKKNILKRILKESSRSIKIILTKMMDSIKKVRLNINTPKFFLFKVPTKYIGIIIGVGGKNIQKIEKDTNTNIIIRERENNAVIEIFGKKFKEINSAIKIIKNVIFQPKHGYFYSGKIITVKKNNIIVSLLCDKDIMLNLPNNNNYKEGDVIKFKYLNQYKFNDES